MPQHNRSVLADHPALDVLEAICDVLDTVGSARLPQPLRHVRLELHSTLALSDAVGEMSICRHLAEQFADIASEAQRQEAASFFTESGAVLSPSRELHLDHG